MLIVLIVLLLLFGFGGFYGSRAGWGPHYAYGGFGIGGILLVVLIVWLISGGIGYRW